MSGELHRVGLKELSKVLGVGCRGPVPYLLVGVQTLLASQRGRVFSKREILDHLYLAEYPDSFSDLVRHAVCRLRDLGVPVTTYYGRGYSIELDEVIEKLPAGSTLKSHRLKSRGARVYCRA